LIGAARTTVIHEESAVEGSIYLAGVELDMLGQLGKDLHFAGLSARVAETADFAHDHGGIISASLSTVVDDGAVVPGSVITFAYQLVINGDVGGEISFSGSALTITGTVDDSVFASVGGVDGGGASAQIESLLIPFRLDVELRNGGLRVMDDGFISGVLDYQGPTRGLVEPQQVGGSIVYEDTGPSLADQVQPSRRTFERYLDAVVNEFVALGLIGVVLILLAPTQIQAPLRDLQIRPISTLGIGMLSFILSFPIVLIIVLVSVLVILLLSLLPLQNVIIFGGVVLGLANVGLASVFYFTAIYIARIVVALAIGRFLVHLFADDDPSELRWRLVSLAVGILLVALAGAVPVFGTVFNALILFLGLGAILNQLRVQFQRYRESNQPAPPRRTQETVKVFPYTPEEPLVTEETLKGLGMENLPDGFEWWRDDE
jgi:hypothetical protein